MSGAPRNVGAAAADAPADAPEVVVVVSSHLFGYTARQRELRARGATIDAAMRDLDARHPGLYFRMVDEAGRLRPHLNVFVGEERVRDLATPLAAGATLHILGALSGG